MAKEQSNTATTNTTCGSRVDCQVSVNRRVQYIFKTGLWEGVKASEKSLRIPVAVAIDGTAKPEFAKKTSTLLAYKAFDIWVKPGQHVSLYLNSDAGPGRRAAPVFEVTPSERNVLVIVNEKRGLLGDHDTPKLVGTKTDKHGQEYDEYEAVLSGDVWKKVSHRFTAQEAKALIPGETPAAIRDQVLSIYDGRCQGPLSIQREHNKLRIEFERADNAISNVTNFNMYSDGLPRVHPSAWLAVIDAAIEAGVSVVRTTSAWRPMLGAIVHRTGLGLDVNYLDGVHLNRAGLTDKDAKKHVARSPSVSAKERELFVEKERADAEAKSASAHLHALDRQLAKMPANDPRRAVVQSELDDAEVLNKQAIDDQVEATRKWNKERDANEPNAVKSFRRYLLQCECVSQVFDPWFMDANTQDSKAPVPNLQQTGNEGLHGTHLHVTVKNPGMSL